MSSDKKRFTHEQCRQKICVLCVTKKPSVGPIRGKVCDQIRNHIPGLDFKNDPRLPNGICSNCRQGLNGIKGHKLPAEASDYTKFTVNYPSPSSPHNDATCWVCKLGRMDIITARKLALASKVAAGKIEGKLDLCPECLAYKTEGIAHSANSWNGRSPPLRKPRGKTP